MFVTDGGAVDFARSVFLALDRETSRDFTLPFYLSPGGYRVFVYDIKQDGTLSSGVGYPAVRSELITTGNGLSICYNTLFIQLLNCSHPYAHLENCQITTSPHHITVKCTYPVNSMAIGFQVIAQLGVQERVHRLYINQSLPDHTSASVEVEESGEYLVSILPIIEGRGVTGSNVEYREIVAYTTSGKFTMHYYG